MTRKKRVLIAGICVGVLVILGIIYSVLAYYNILPKRSYDAAHFNIQTIQSGMDYNNNGIDDYSDILLGAKKEAKRHPTYNGAYYKGGYPPDNIGVCTDVVWRSFKEAGYCLKDMVNADIKKHPELYKRVTGEPDPNIDFRRVPNLKVYFERHALSLTLDTSKIEQWQPGDIVVFSHTHIGILSDKRNADGIPYLIHNSGQLHFEEDALLRQKEITGHYRFDATRLQSFELIPFNS